MFLLQAALRCCVYKLLCLDGNCSEHYTGDDDCVFFLSKQTCVGDEIAWDFISRITTSNCSFTSFCSDMCRIYTSNFLIAHPFLSRSTFVKFWFAWLAAHNIDFRKGVDRWCGPDRKLLACLQIYIACVGYIGYSDHGVHGKDCANLSSRSSTRFQRS